MRERGGGGRVINISSVHEELPFPHFASYCASKGGLKMLMRDLAIELAPLGITVNNVAPGAVKTPINTHLMSEPALVKPLLANIPLNRLGTPEDVAGTVAFLASEAAPTEGALAPVWRGFAPVTERRLCPAGFGAPGNDLEHASLAGASYAQRERI